MLSFIGTECRATLARGLCSSHHSPSDGTLQRQAHAVPKRALLVLAPFRTLSAQPAHRTASRLAAIDCTYAYLDQGLALLVR